MLFTEKVVDSLNGIECPEWHFHKDSVPIAHCTVPKSWQLESLELLAVLALA